LEKFPTRINIDDPDNPIFLIDKSQGTIKKGTETLVLARLSGQDLTDIKTLTSLTVLGTYEEVFADPDKTLIYDRVYDQTPIDFDDGEGGVMTYTPPRKFVVFA
jgi:hypothetical protein